MTDIQLLEHLSERDKRNWFGRCGQHTVFRHTLSRYDMAWLVNTHSTVHPPFSGKAKLKSTGLRPVYEAICGRKCRTFDYSRSGCIGFNLKEHGPNDKRPSLLEEWKISQELASMHGFKDKVAVTRTGNSRTAHTCIDCSVDFSVEHVLVSSVEKAKAFCTELMDHRSSNTVIGPHIVKIHEVGVSFTDKAAADKLCSSESKKDNKKLLAYLAKHAINNIFLTPLRYLS
jgi:hypothetical protein